MPPYQHFGAVRQILRTRLKGVARPDDIDTAGSIGSCRSRGSRDRFARGTPPLGQLPAGEKMPMSATTHTPKVKDVLTTGEVAKICNVAPRTVSKWFDSGALHGYRIPGSKDRRIPLNQLIRFMKQHGMPLNGLMTGCTRVLIVDDEQDIVEVLEKILEDEAKYEVEVARSGFAAGITAARHFHLLFGFHLQDLFPKLDHGLLRSEEDKSELQSP